MSRAPACATGTVRIPSPLGELLLVATPRGLAELRFCGQQDTSHGTACPPPLPTTNVPPAVQEHLRQAHRELDAYFDGRLRAFSLALDVRGTPFQRRVWQALQDIPYGETWSYAMLAAHIGRPSACRAVGNANGKNPLPVIIPCHRVVHADGGLGGYSAGLGIKRFLLALEQRRHEKSPLAGA